MFRVVSKYLNSKENTKFKLEPIVAKKKLFIGKPLYNKLYINIYNAIMHTNLYLSNLNHMNYELHYNILV